MRVSILLALLSGCVGAIAQQLPSIERAVPGDTVVRYHRKAIQMKESGILSIREFPDLRKSVEKFAEERVRSEQGIRPASELKVSESVERIDEANNVFELSFGFLESIHSDEQEQDVVEVDTATGVVRRRVVSQDSRFDLSDLDFALAENGMILNNTLSVFGVVLKETLDCVSDTTSCNLISTITCAEKFKLCPGERWRDEVSLCLGTAFLVHPSYLITARHVVEAVPLSQLCFVTGFRTSLDKTTRTSFLRTEVAFAQEVILDPRLDQYDVAIVKLTKPSGLPPMTVDGSHRPRIDERVYTLGYPLGMPIKGATNASIKIIHNDYLCESTLDTFQGNSGSPVFDSETHKVIGLLIGGSDDFVDTGGCNKSNHCVSALCDRERVLTLSAFSDILNALID